MRVASPAPALYPTPAVAQQQQQQQHIHPKTSSLHLTTIAILLAVWNSCMVFYLTFKANMEFQAIKNVVVSSQSEADASAAVVAFPTPSIASNSFALQHHHGSIGDFFVVRRRTKTSMSSVQNLNSNVNNMKNKASARNITATTQAAASAALMKNFLPIVVRRKSRPEQPDDTTIMMMTPGMVTKVAGNKMVTSKKLPPHLLQQQQALARLAPGEKPTFYLHVGLHKTGTSFIQDSFCNKYKNTERLLLKDNFVYLGTCPRTIKKNSIFPFQFLKHEDDSVMLSPMSWPCQGFLNLVVNGSNVGETEDYYPFQYRFMKRLEELKHARNHVFMVYETFSCWSERMVKQLRDLLQPNWNVKVIVAHRPLYEWLLSYHLFMHRAQTIPKSDWSGKVLLNSSIPFDLKNSKESIAARLYLAIAKHTTHPAELVRRHYAKYFTNVQVMPIRLIQLAHQKNSVMAKEKAGKPTKDEVGSSYSDKGDPVLKYFICNILKATETCKEARNGKIFSTKRNEAIDFTEEVLRRDARKYNLLPTQTWTALEKYYRVKNLSLADMPKTCPDQAQLDRFEKLSISTERKLSGKNWTSVSENEHRAGFNKLIEKKAFCTVNSDVVLTNKDWLRFYQDRSWTKPGFNLTKGGRGDNASISLPRKKS